MATQNRFSVVKACFNHGRAVCEHFAFSGAVIDLFATAFKINLLVVILFAKAAFVAGCVGVYLLHKEERKLKEEIEKEAIAAAKAAAAELRRVA